MAFNEPDTSGGRLNPRDIVGHLLLVWPTEYVQHSPTKFSKADKSSDVIVVDVVDLDDVDPGTGEPGLLVQGAWWRQSKLIQSLKRKVGSPDPMLAFMTQGTSSPGFNAPFILVSATSDPGSVQRAQEWINRNPGFAPEAPAVSPVDRTPTQVPEKPTPTPNSNETILARLARTAAEGPARLQAPASGFHDPDPPGF